MNQALDNFLGLVFPSGKLLFGFDNLKKVKAGRVKLIVIMSSASEKTKESALNFARLNRIDHLLLESASIPNLVNGKNLAVFSVLDINIASKIKKTVKEGDTYE
ncbi:MAG TPA: hypothetical protein VJZ31_00550 [Bacilli bacterium]|nr:hypothetical protein [Bacilli bacterium]